MKHENLSRPINCEEYCEQKKMRRKRNEKITLKARQGEKKLEK